MNLRKLWLVLILLATVLFLAQSLSAQSDDIAVLEIDGAINQTLFTYLERGLEEARRADAAAVLVTMDTPGGETNAMLEIVRLFQNSPLPVIVHVGPDGAQAASAGSVITAAAHAAGMASNTVIGAASPINGDGSDIGETLYRKLVEDLKATMRSLTERRGADAVALGEQMIEDARAVSASEALAVGFIDAIADTPEELLTMLDGLEVEVEGEMVALETANKPLTSIPMRFIEQFLYFIATPTVISILMAIAVPAILSEISNPGGWVAGFIGVVALALGLYGLGQLPVNWLGLVLVGIAFVLFILEVTSANHGALAVTGSITLLAGLLVLFNSPGTPEFARISIPTAVTVTLFISSFFFFIIIMALRAQRAQPYSGREGMVGKLGKVQGSFTGNADEHFAGNVLVLGEIWQAQADEPIQTGDRVVIKEVDGLTLRVRKTNDEGA